ncbi:hypothetical protein [Mycolicibacterium poriferae]|uniref:hypothetical protein n=1 Tax=Mycolicibacterium poriferae TaxID=39694 RepID=UPI003216FC01
MANGPRSTGVARTSNNSAIVTTAILATGYISDSPKATQFIIFAVYTVASSAAHAAPNNAPATMTPSSSTRNMVERG